MTCTNKTLKELGTLHGVFGAEINSADGKIEVSHTDEVTRTEIEAKLRNLDFEIIAQTNENEYDAPSIWGCAL
jgi:hypothetical protein